MGFVNDDDDGTIWAPFYDQIESGKAIDDVVDDAMQQEQIQDYLRATVRARIYSVIRNRTRRKEHKAIEAYRGGDVATAKRELVGQTFALPSGRFVEWHKATAAEHRERAQWQRGKALSLEQDAIFHEVAAQVIEEAGVKNLGQIRSIENWPEPLKKIVGVKELDS